MKHNPLPPDFLDRPHLQRWWVNVLVLLRIKQVKAVCCESYRKEGKMMACKGCAKLYDMRSPSWFYRFVARVAKRHKLV